MDAGTLETSKRLQLFREVLPHGLPTALIFSSSYPGMKIYVDQAMEAARQLRITLEPIDIPTRDEDVIALVGPRRIGGAMIALDPVVATQGKRLIETALQKRWPTMFVGVVARRFVEAGGLMSYDANREEAWRRTAAHVDKILKGAKPSDMPLEQPTKFELVINLKT